MNNPDLSAFPNLASITRDATDADGKQVQSSVASSILISPIEPADPNIARLYGVDTPFSLLRAFTRISETIKQGDKLTVTASSEEYPIKAVSKYEDGLQDGVRVYLYDLLLEEVIE